MLTDNQIAALLAAAPFLILSVTWAIGDYAVNRKAARRG